MATDKRVRLMIPGPVDVEDDILAALAEPTLPHYGQTWQPIYQEALESLKQVFGTRNDLFMIPGAGTAALEAGMSSLMRSGDRVLVPYNGFFGRRMGTVAQGWGLEVIPVEVPPGQPLDPDAIRRHLAAEPNIQAVVVVHLETSTGVLNPLREIAAVTNELGVPIIVDAVSSLGGVPLLVDEWGIDVCVTVINKCLACPPGVAPISISRRAWEQIERKGDRAHGWYLNLETWRWYAANWPWHPTPVTLPTNNIVALLTSLRRIMESGLEAHYTRFAQAAHRVREDLRRLGFEMFAADDCASPLITAVRPLPGMNVSDFQKYLLREHQILISGGLDDLFGKIFRVGHIGRAASPDYVEAFLAGVEAYLGQNRA